MCLLILISVLSNACVVYIYCSTAIITTSTTSSSIQSVSQSFRQAQELPQRYFSSKKKTFSFTFPFACALFACRMKAGFWERTWVFRLYRSDPSQYRCDAMLRGLFCLHMAIFILKKYFTSLRFPRSVLVFHSFCVGHSVYFWWLWFDFILYVMNVFYWLWFFFSLFSSLLLYVHLIRFR